MEHQKLPQYQKEERPWGNFERFTQNEKTTVKLVRVNAGEAISLQHHANRDEFWRILEGSGIVVIGEQLKAARPGNEFLSPRGTNHRVEAGPAGMYFLEIAFGEFDEQDIVRLEDKYGRA